jgi:hypothetical protein
MANTKRPTNPRSQPDAAVLNSIHIVFQPVSEGLDLCSAGSSASLPETVPQTFEEAGRRSAERNRAALTELAKW